MYIHSIYIMVYIYDGVPRWHSSKESTCQWRRYRRHGFDSWIRKIPWRRKWLPTPAFLPGKFHEQRMGHSPLVCKKLNMTEHACSQRHTYVIYTHGLNDEIKSTRNAFVWVEGKDLPSPNWIYKYSYNTSLGWQ